MDCSMSGLPVHHRLPDPTQTHVHHVGDTIQHLILHRPLLLPPSIFPSIRIFSNELVLRIRWPKYWTKNQLVGEAWTQGMGHHAATLNPLNSMVSLFFRRSLINYQGLREMEASWRASPSPFRACIWSGAWGQRHKLKVYSKSLNGDYDSLKDMGFQSHKLVIIFFRKQWIVCNWKDIHFLRQGCQIRAKANQVQVWHSYDSLSRVDYTQQ